MNKIITSVVVVMILGAGGGIYWMEHGNKVTVQNIQKEIVEKVVEVPSKETEFEKRAREAINASSTEIEAAVEKAAKDKRENMENEIRLQVTRQMREELDEQEATLEEKVSFH